MTKRPKSDFDIVIVGSGPAGVSAAFPLVDAGLRVLMVDGGSDSRLTPPDGQFLEIRRKDLSQFDWMIGRDFHALKKINADSPKLRAATHARVFENFQAANRIVANDFVAIGSLAPGGLSNAWGCGVACLTKNELARLPISPSEMLKSYEVVATRIGVSGRSNDDLSDLFGLDEWSQPPVPTDELHSHLLIKYSHQRKILHQTGFRLGRSRLAALTVKKDERQACALCGTCIWGCEHLALYSATSDLNQLLKKPGFNYLPGFLVEEICPEGNLVAIKGKRIDGPQMLHAQRVLLAAGTLATTRLALKAINHRTSVRIQSCPTAAFMLWLPRHLGNHRKAAFGLGQLSFSLDLNEDIQGFGSLFNTTGIPISEFARHMPFGKRYGIDLLSKLLTSCVVGNLFLPGLLSDATAQLDEKDQLLIHGGYCNEVKPLMSEAHLKLRNSFRRLGALLIPTSFKVGRPGSDIHYSATLPMSSSPNSSQTNHLGELSNGKGIHIVDGASLTFLPAKSHTLTIMANSDRIARHISKIMKPH